ncbi:MAG: hypothetical protein Q9220_002691 [cf. Caloplaca sp. 1 TL-2023]
MTDSKPSRTVNSFNLERCQRQFFQWYYIEKMSYPRVTKAFDDLFRRIVGPFELEVKVTEEQWRNRHRQWIKVWGEIGRGGGDVSVPECIRPQKIWCKNGGFLFHSDAQLFSRRSAGQEADTLEHVLAAANDALSKHSASIDYGIGMLVPNIMTSESVKPGGPSLQTHRPNTIDQSSSLAPGDTMQTEGPANDHDFAQADPTLSSWEQSFLPNFSSERFGDGYLGYLQPSGARWEDYRDAQVAEDCALSPID